MASGGTYCEDGGTIIGPSYTPSIAFAALVCFFFAPVLMPLVFLLIDMGEEDCQEAGCEECSMWLLPSALADWIVKERAQRYTARLMDRVNNMQNGDRVIYSFEGDLEATNNSGVPNGCQGTISQIENDAIEGSSDKDAIADPVFYIHIDFDGEVGYKKLDLEEAANLELLGKANEVTNADRKAIAAAQSDQPTDEQAEELRGTLADSRWGYVHPGKKTRLFVFENNGTCWLAKPNPTIDQAPKGQYPSAQWEVTGRREVRSKTPEKQVIYRFNE